MRKITKNDKFDYILLCNKICGAAHSNMQMSIIVESEADYKKWLSEQKTFSSSWAPEAPKAEVAPAADSTATAAKVDSTTVTAAK